MGKTSERIAVPSLAQIVQTNKVFIDATGGFFSPPDNLLNESSLIWVLNSMIAPSLFGVNHYPKLADKASLLAWTIINNHVFYDGNKRTGMAAMIIFLIMNDRTLGVTNEDIYEIAQKIVRYKELDYTRQDLISWIEEKTTGI